MPPLSEFNVFWLSGASCDGCTISVLGDTSVVPLEALLTGAVPGLPRINLVHPVVAAVHGREFIELYERAARGEMDPFALVVETSIPRRLEQGGGSWAWMGSGPFSDIGAWVDRLARRAAVVIALGDCAVYGGPHTSEESNPIGAYGVEQHLGPSYRTSLGLPVVHLPGCCPPPVLAATVAGVLKWVQGDGPLPELDELHRPKFAYPDVADMLDEETG